MPMVRRPCHHEGCLACRSERQDFCYTGDFTERGIKMQHGFMTEFVVDDQKYMNVVPRRAARRGGAGRAADDCGEGHQADLAGAATPAVGLPDRDQGRARALPQSRGARRRTGRAVGRDGVRRRWLLVYVYSREAAPNPKAELVESFGATYVSAQDTSVEQLAEKVGNIDVVYEATGASQRIVRDAQARRPQRHLRVHRCAGTQGPIEVDTDLIMRNMVLKNQVVLGTVNAGRDTFEAAIKDLGEFMQRWPAGAVAHHGPLPDVGVPRSVARRTEGHQGDHHAELARLCAAHGFGAPLRPAPQPACD